MPRAERHKGTLHIRSFGAVQKSSSSKAAASFARRAYFQYVSTEKWRERRWRFFSTAPSNKLTAEEYGEEVRLNRKIHQCYAIKNHGAGENHLRER